ncbi:MAG: hypothetical protein FOGNACKC_06272 [Anaerolineae bacterium]|nr:hypothetical protein [Anaerolineae bacterium]
MSCNRCAATTEAVAPTAGAAHLEGNWAGNRAAVRQCEDCGAFLRRDGGCTRCEAAQFADDAQWLAENLAGDAAAETEWEPSPDEPQFTAMAIAAVRGGKTLTWRDEAEERRVERELRYDPLQGRYGVESFYYEVQGEPYPATLYEPAYHGEWVQTGQEYDTYDTYEAAYAALQGRKARRSASPAQPGTDYFEANIEPVDPAWLNGFVESPEFSRKDGERILQAIRQNAVGKLAARRYTSQTGLDQAVAAINANTLKHSAQVMVMATKISRLTGADPQTARRAGLAAGYHDSGKDNTNFVYHHLDSANFAQTSLWDTGLAQTGGKTMAEAAAEVAAVRQAILEHMPFGDGSDPGNFMNRALAGEAAGIVKVDGQAYKKRLRYLMNDALQQDEAAIRRVEAWVDAHADRYETKDALAEAMRQEFGGRELSYPAPSGEAARILHTAAAGEHLAETVRGDDGKSLLESSFSASDITWAADGLTLSSAESLDKIVRIHQIQWGRAGTEPIIVSMSSLAGGAFGNGGTAVDAAKSMTIPAARAAAEQEIRLMREFMARWQAETLTRWAAGPPPQPAIEVNRRKKLPLLQSLEPEEMLRFQPTMAEFGRRYQDFLQQNAPRRGELFRD